MARHNREGRGRDQLGYSYGVSYQPDWFDRVKVTRVLPSGRQSTKTLFRNPEREQVGVPGDSVRFRVWCFRQELDVEIVVNDPARRVRELRFGGELPDGGSEDERLEFTVYARAPQAD